MWCAIIYLFVRINTIQSAAKHFCHVNYLERAIDLIEMIFLFEVYSNAIFHLKIHFDGFVVECFDLMNLNTKQCRGEQQLTNWIELAGKMNELAYG